MAFSRLDHIYIWFFSRIQIRVRFFSENSDPVRIRFFLKNLIRIRSIWDRTQNCASQSPPELSTTIAEFPSEHLTKWTSLVINSHIAYSEFKRILFFFFINIREYQFARNSWKLFKGWHTDSFLKL